MISTALMNVVAPDKQLTEYRMQARGGGINFVALYFYWLKQFVLRAKLVPDPADFAQQFVCWEEKLESVQRHFLRAFLTCTKRSFHARESRVLAWSGFDVVGKSDHDTADCSASDARTPTAHSHG